MIKSQFCVDSASSPAASMRRLPRIVGVFAAALVCVVTFGIRPALAQSGAGAAAVQGAVTDPQQAGVPGASVIIRNVETGYERIVFADAQGRYYASAMPVGVYWLTATAPGFTSMRREDVRFRVGVTETVHFSLGLAGVDETVYVTSDDHLLDRELTTGTVVPSMAVTDLPIRGRDFTEFIQLTPGIIQEPDRNGLVMSGQRSINSNISIDGADFNDPLQGNQRGGNEAVFFFPQSAVLEFQVLRHGATPEIGRTTSGFVNVVTKSGTNDLHGQSFLFARHKALTSRDAFGYKLDHEQQQLGGAVGGPIRKDRAFFFAAVEQSLLRVPLLVKFPQQSIPLPPEIAALEGDFEGTNDPTVAFARTDVTLGPTTYLNVQGTYTRFRGENFDFDSRNTTRAMTTNYTRTGESRGVKVGFTSIVGGAVNEVRVQVATDDREENPNSNLAFIGISGFGELGGDRGRPRIFKSTRYQISDTFSLMLGSHRLRAGIDANLNDLRQARYDNIQGRYDFRSLQDYVAGRINRYRQTIASFDIYTPFFDARQTELGVFVQDQFPISMNISATAGVRWDGQWNPQPTRPNPAIPQTTRIPHDLEMWQPRAGLAWDIGGAGHSVVRVAGGVYAGRTPGTLIQRVFTDNGLVVQAVDSRFDPALMAFVRFPNRLDAVPEGIRTIPGRVFGFDPAFRNPRAYQGSVAFERRLSNRNVVTISYVHNTGRNLQRRLDRNLFPPTIDATGMPIFPRQRPNPAIGRLSINESTAKSQYDGVTIAFERQPSARFYFQTSYTLAENLDDDSNERNFSGERTLNPFDLAAEWGPSKYDVRHTFNAHAVAMGPWGISVGALVVARSGAPFTPMVGFDTQNDGNDDNDRAIIDGRVARRNSMRQPAFVNVDLRVLKSFRFGNEGRSVDLLAEVFNATRAKNLNFGADSESFYGTPSAPVETAGTPLFAPSTARFGGPRQVQLGVRVVF